MFVWVTTAFVTAGLACGFAVLVRFGRTRAGIIGAIGYFWWAFAGLFRIASYIGQIDISSLSDFFTIAYVLAFALVIYSWATLPIVTEAEAESSSASMPAVERPRVVTAVGTLLIVLAIIGLLSVMYIGQLVEFDRRYLPVLGPLALGAIIQIGLGAGILAGINWVRLAYFVMAPASIAIALALGRFSSTGIVQIVIFVVATYGLTRPAAVVYFKPESQRTPE